MAHITQSQKQQIADLRAAGVSFVKIAQQTGIPKGTCKTIFYKDRPPAQPSVKGKNGQFRTTAPRTGPGRKPANGIEAASDKARAAACRARRKERMAQLAGNLSAASDAELTTLLAQAIRTSDTSTVRVAIGLALESELGERRGRPSVEKVGISPQLEGQKTREIAAEMSPIGDKNLPIGKASQSSTRTAKKCCGRLKIG